MIDQTLEKEVGGELTLGEFKNKWFELEALENSQIRNRLSIQITDFSNEQLDTRIRITNGDAEILQKLGGWNDETRQEVELKIPNNADFILKIYKVINNLLTSGTVERTIIQMQSMVLTKEEYEIKLTHQLGKRDCYNFEVEVFNHSLNPVEVSKEYGLTADLSEKDAAYWSDFNKCTNLSADNLSESELRELVTKYLKKNN